MTHDIKQLIPKHLDGQARILAIGRLSKPKETEEETQETIESSLAVAREHIKNIYKGPMILTQLAEQESGLIADRATILEAEELIATGEIDLVIAEDLSRIYRSPRHQYVFVDDCVDSDVRVICVADRLDTSEEDWESAMDMASFRHSFPINDCRRRQKRKSTVGFHGGGNVQKIKYGYVRLTRDQAASGQHGPVRLRIAKMPEATRIIKKMREILMSTRNGLCSYVPVVDYLIENNIPVGPYVTNGKWNQRLVKGLLTDPILIGVRRFRTMLFKRVRSTGKFRRELNPDGPETEHYPELAHLTDDEFVTMQAAIEEIAEQHKNIAGSDHPLYRKPRKDAIFPRQHATCSACNGLMYAYDSDQIKCENAHARGADHCWNHVQVDMEQAHQKVIPWLIAQFEGVPGFRGLLVDCALEELASIRAKLHQGRPSRRLTISQLEREATNVAKAIRVGGDLEALLKEAKDIEEQLGK
ncbi:MAG: recombinase family protein, partial [Planctomycetaceae bacterium]|nr:recombinase family protein [Planctomycetaceae bacterium]